MNDKLLFTLMNDKLDFMKEKLNELQTEMGIKNEMIFDCSEALHGTIRAKGHKLRVNGSYDINTSSILTKLIQDVGRLCESYASDLFIQWQYNIEQKLKDGSIQSGTEVFAIRESGIDHKEWYELHKDHIRYYRAVWFLDITISDDGEDIEMVLHK